MKAPRSILVLITLRAVLRWLQVSCDQVKICNLYSVRDRRKLYTITWSAGSG